MGMAQDLIAADRAAREGRKAPDSTREGGRATAESTAVELEPGLTAWGASLI